ncbi:MAG: hypothetical protein LBI38_03665 [Oscillospiraceae bacterium]|jgi:hypothetical protein|nr:hypothetical protein [Oscillospiraceae bacterium]
MINEVISGVCGALSEEFGDAFPVYTEKAVQGAVKPCFFVACKNPKSGSVKDRYFISRQLLGNRYLKRVGLCVEFFPAADDVRGECGEVLDRLFLCLEYIPFMGGTLRGRGMQGEYAEDMLNFFVNYDAFVYLGEEKDVMEKITVEEEFIWR